MTFESVFEILNGGVAERKTRFWDYFDGSNLKAWWSIQDFGITVSMEDAIDEGLKIVTGSVSIDNGWIYFNDIRHYEPTGAVFISVFRTLSLLNFFSRTGLFNDTQDGNQFNYIQVAGDSTLTNWRLFTRNTGSSANVDTGVALDTNFHVFRGEEKSASAELLIDGFLKATGTTALSVLKEQPAFGHGTRAPAVKEGHIRYFEAWNT